uniref:C-type lectin domain-containing protein n=1 Tax=Anopheles farauti TaxID=69004 RepID=A0A182QWB7_9DIPT
MVHRNRSVVVEPHRTIMNASLIVLALVGIVPLILPTTSALRYTVHNTKVPLYEAWTQCITKGGYLASPATAKQNLEIWNEVKKTGTSDGWWLSGTDNGMEGSWIWLSRNVPIGIINGYTNWASTEPNNHGGTEHCMRMEYTSGKWYDLSCDLSLYYVCEYYSL